MKKTKAFSYILTFSMSHDEFLQICNTVARKAHKRYSKKFRKLYPNGAKHIEDFEDLFSCKDIKHFMMSVWCEVFIRMKDYEHNEDSIRKLKKEFDLSLFEDEEIPSLPF